MKIRDVKPRVYSNKIAMMAGLAESNLRYKHKQIAKYKCPRVGTFFYL